MIDSHDFPSYYFNIQTRGCTLFFRSFWIDFLKSEERVFRALSNSHFIGKGGGWLMTAFQEGDFPRKQTRKQMSLRHLSVYLSLKLSPTVVRGSGPLSHWQGWRETWSQWVTSHTLWPTVVWLQALLGETVDHLIFNNQLENSNWYRQDSGCLVPLLCKNFPSSCQLMEQNHRRSPVAGSNRDTEGFSPAVGIIQKRFNDLIVASAHT